MHLREIYYQLTMKRFSYIYIIRANSVSRIKKEAN